MLQQAIETIRAADLTVSRGRVERVTGLSVESVGPAVRIGEVCRIFPNTGGRPVMAEVVGFRDKSMLLMPYDNLQGVGPGSVVESTGHSFYVPVGMDMVGRVLDGVGTPIDGKGPIASEAHYLIDVEPANPLQRPRIKERMPLGVKVIDGLLTCGKGQRIGIFAGSGVGKSTLMGMIARNAQADVNVIALVGERGRELRDFMEKDLQAEGMARTVLVVATSDRPAMARVKCALVATAVAEFFRDKGKNVMLMMDSLTRFAMAQREIGLATGEPPVARGYTPSIFAVMPKLLERSGNFNKGSITGIYTVLVEGDDMNEPVADTVRGILDGHIVLTRALAMRNHYPAIDVLASISRLMPDIADPAHMELAGKMRRLMATYENYADLISIGAYKPGSSEEVDTAIRYHKAIETFLCQRVGEPFSFSRTIDAMRQALA
ncbi:flagellar protein export ATPase FliI [Ethanoligenens harbinense]|uniref:ATPase, FliI/YscN family n=1 Tax=Ethanoligenens harbinense (strain DSM 18485 / JCM 12961 / CGMCC 1.5033 / YUAN-3) TaxID=663278 RepID=E6U6J8_ETHHY|nr:flagellar protein export ATPase FliI [Ethanoligenens harbinense]ADU28068.1 ATPase, FliI/YscN family [Ethanoligenens harbinense YUAN-3]AVQ97083.1 flagellar protein export ATPase FliI [Ethanoligenens harbinense YUAN-3]AYF39745.1 flagellar protein export ATPase FliI [Ethanoligenens harbinense]AYF42578.1 flagellar protein export ATPase FliI [Ethanoligenens harbinense]QCN93326.1 flagellar protein export ATPase FliI [Ethanoligenens harbinense]